MSSIFVQRMGQKLRPSKDIVNCELLIVNCLGAPLEDRLLLGEDKAQAKAAVPVAGGEVATVRRATVPRVAVPAASTVHAVLPT